MGLNLWKLENRAKDEGERNSLPFKTQACWNMMGTPNSFVKNWDFWAAPEFPWSIINMEAQAKGWAYHISNPFSSALPFFIQNVSSVRPRGSVLFTAMSRPRHGTYCVHIFVSVHKYKQV